MSVAHDLVPIVDIPERARRTSRPRTRSRHLVLLAPAPCTNPTRYVPLPVDDELAGAVVTDHPASGVRLTRRGRLAVALGIAVAAIAMVLTAYLSAGSAALGRTTPPAPASVTVQSGDTLWSIAQRVAPNRDPRAVVDDLRSVNHLTSAEVSPGQVLRLR